MASRYRYDDEYETQRPSPIGLLKVIQSHPPPPKKHQTNSPSDHRPKTLPPSPLQTRPTRLPHNSPHLHHRPLPPRDRLDSLHALLLELRAAHRLRKGHTPPMGRYIRPHAIGGTRDSTG
jgi:hypothetical protein